MFDSLLATLGGIALLGSLAAGTFTYSESDLYFGPSKEYIEQLADGEFDGGDPERDLLHTFGVWIGENSEEVRFYNRLLFATQVLLLLGVVLLGLAVDS